MNFGKLGLKNFVCVVPVCLAIVFAGCEIGLGAAVDVEAPKVEVVSPSTNAAVGSNFTIYGVCEDDAEVTSVEIVRIYKKVKDSSGNIVEIQWPTEEEQSKGTTLGRVKPAFNNSSRKWEWSVPLQYVEKGTYTCNGYTLTGIIDGNYIVDTRSYDGFERPSTIASRSFDIDNTRPVFILSSPSELEKSAGRTEFGRTVSVSGVIADVHGVDVMKVRVFDENLKEISLTKSEFRDFDKANTNVNIAVYSAAIAEGKSLMEDGRAITEEDRILHDNYMALFGLKGKTKFNVDISDVEKRNIYLFVEVIDKAGNKSGSTYSGTPLLLEIREKLGIPDLQFEASDCMKVLDETYEGLSNDKIEIIRNLLEGTDETEKTTYRSYLNGTEHNYYQIAVSPNNAPTYTVVGFDVKNYGTDDEKWIASADDKSIPITINAGSDGVKIDRKKLAVKIYDVAVDEKTKEKKLTLDVEINNDSSDALKNCITHTNSAESLFPATSVENAYITAGHYLLKLEKLKEVTGVAYEANSLHAIVIEGKDEKGVSIARVDAFYGFSILSNALPAVVSSNDKGVTKKYDIIGKAGYPGFPLEISDEENAIGGEKGSLTYTIDYYDGRCITADEIDEKKIEPIASYSKSETEINNTKFTPAGEKKWNCSIPLIAADSLSGKNVTIKIRVRANNGKAKGDWFTFLIYSDGVNPELTLNNESELSKKKIGRSSSYFKAVDGKNYYELSGTVSDVDGSGIKTIEYSLDGRNYTPVDSAPKVTNEASWHHLIEMNDGEGKSLYVKATDEAGNVSRIKQYTGLTFDFSIPEVEITSALPAEYCNSDQTIEFTATDGYKIETPNATVNGVSEKLTSLGAGKWTVKVSSEGKKTVEITATDPLGQKSAPKVVEFTIDKMAPKMNPMTVSGEKTGNYYTSSTIKIDGTCEDSTGLQQVEYWIVRPDGTPTEHSTQPAAGKQFSITPEGFSSENGGKNVVHVKAKDLAGNVSTEQTVEVYIDHAAPALSVVYFDDFSDSRDLGGVPSTLYFGPNKPVKMTLYGLVSDEGGVSSVDFALSGNKITPTIKYTTSALNENSPAANFTGATWVTNIANADKPKITAWKADFVESAITTALGSGATLSVTAKDNAGRITTATDQIQLIKDIKAPDFEVTNVASSTVLTEDTLTDGSLVIRGTWSDIAGSGTSSLECTVAGARLPVEKIEAPETTAPVSWNVTIPKSMITAGNNKKISFTAKDAVGNVKTAELTDLTFDYQIPVLTATEVQEYYGYSTSPMTVTFTGTDDRGIKEIKTTSILRDGANSAGCTFTYSAGKGVASIPRTGGSSYDGVWEITVVAVDQSDRESLPLVIRTTVDGSKPSAPTFDFVAGTRYSADNWCNNSVVQVTATANDEGNSGIKAVYYKVTDSTVSSVSDMETSNDGTVAAVAGQQFNLTLSDLPDNVGTKSSKLWLQSVDNAGNKSPVSSAIINVDQVAPEVMASYYTYDGTAFKAASGFVRINAANNMTLYGNIDETCSGLSEITFSSNGTKISSGITITYSKTRIGTVSKASDLPTGFAADNTGAKSFKAVIENGKIREGALTVEAKDKAGNTVSQTLFSVIKDTSNPVVTLKTPHTKLFADNSGNSDSTAVVDVNGTITVSGTVSDDEIDTVSLSYSFDSDSGWSTPVSKTGSDAYNWSFDLDVTKIVSGALKFIDNSNYTGSPKDFYVRIVALDAAGNTTTHIYKYNINPESDRPVINIGNVTIENMTASNAIWVMSRNIFGTITDDDGIKSFKYRVGTTGTFTDVTVNNGLWSIDLDDGSNLVCFQIEDNASTVFESGKSQWFTPKLNDGTNEINNYSYLNLKVDTTPPTVGAVEYNIYNGSSYSGYSTNYVNGLFGGEYSKLKFRFPLSDTNGIKSVEVNFNDKRAYFVENPTVTAAPYETAEISLKKYLNGDDIVTGACKADIIVTDNAGIETKKTVNFYIDNTAPVIDMTAPSSVNSAVNIYGSVNEIGGELYFAVTQQGADYPSSITVASPAQNGAKRWKKINSTSLAWSVLFDDETNSTEGNHSDMLKWYLTNELGVGVRDESNKLCTVANVNDGTFDETCTITLHIMAVDGCKNRGYKSVDIEVDPQGDKPSVEFSTPADGSIQGGKIRVAGTATDNIEAKYVGLMIDANHDGKWTYADLQILKQDIANPVFGMITKNAQGKVSFNDVTVPASSITDAVCANYALKLPVTGSSWSVILNENEKLNPVNPGDSGKVTIWAFAVDGDGNTSKRDMASSSMKKIEFTVDKDSPKISDMVLTQSGGVLRPYSDGVAIRGQWYFEADIYDDQGISKIEIDGNPAESFTGYTSTPINETGRKGYHIKFPVGNDTVDDVSSETHVIRYAETKDDNPIELSTNISLKIDNMAPVIAKKGETGYNINSKVVNSNGFYTFGSVATENAKTGTNQTGVERVAFYITRDVDAEGGNPAIHNLYDPMIERNGTGNAISSYESLTKEDNIFWKQNTATVSGNVLTIATTDANIHAGGLAKVSGTIYRIKSVNGRTVTLDTSAELKSGTVLFAVANVVDNPIQERTGSTKNSAGYYTDGRYDDDDLMIESFIKQGSKWTWDASINTKNIGDGKAQLHYVVFDEAGNSAVETVDIFISNNQPRIAGLEFASDDNGNLSYEASEVFTQYKNYYPDGMSGFNAVTKAVFPVDRTDENKKTVANVHNNIRIRPEIVGGNGKLYYSASVGSNNLGDKVALNEASGEGVGSQINVTSDADENIVKTGSVEFTVAKMVVAGVTDGNNQKLGLTVSDSTPGGAMEAEMDIWLNFFLKDTTPPNVKIIPFYWDGLEENSLYENSKANGHIELTRDIADASKYLIAALKDKDPKVSGKIKLEGIVHEDNGQVASIKLNIGSKDYAVASFSNGSWTVASAYSMASGIPSGGLGIEVGQATYKDLMKVGIITELPAGKKASALVPEFSQEYNHVVKWIAYIDTEAFSKAKNSGKSTWTDVVVKAYATNRGTPNASGVYATPSTNSPETGLSGGDDGIGLLTAYYKMDVVPYITKVDTFLGRKNKRDASIYGRSALGHYPIQTLGNGTTINTPEKITLDGFNLGGSSIEITDILTDDKLVKQADGSRSYYTLVNDVPSINNFNNNDACGSYDSDMSDEASYDVKNEWGYNRVPNNYNNDNLTDDVVFDVWQFNKEAAKPNDARIEQAIMKINPSNNQVGFAFVNGVRRFSMPGTDSGKDTDSGKTFRSYQLWNMSYDMFTSVDMTFDSLGHSYAVAGAGDTNSSESMDAYSFMTSRWGLVGNAQGSNLGSTNHIWLEAIGQYGTRDNNDDNWYVDKQRARSSSLATTVNGSSTTVYLAYYDSLNAEIRLRQGTFGTTQTGNIFENAAKGDCRNSKASTYYSVTAGRANIAVDYASKPKPYLSIGAVPASVNGTSNDYLVMVWYDGSTLKFQYCTNASTLTKGTQKNLWTTPISVYGSDANSASSGQFCKLTVDSNGGIHIASYDEKKQNLNYAYLPLSKLKAGLSSSDFRTAVVDANGVVGKNITIDVAKESAAGNPIPYIGYYSTSCNLPKYAKLVTGSRLTSGDLNGSVDDKFTGVWETSVVPSPSQIELVSTQFNVMNIGVWKDASGVIKNSTSTASSSGTANGVVYGNGTSNSILGYIVKNGGGSDNIETAQIW